MLPKHLPARPVLPILTEQSRVGLPPCATTANCGHAAGQVPSVQSGWQSPVNVSGSWLWKVIVDDLGWNCCIAAMVTLRKKISTNQSSTEHKETQNLRHTRQIGWELEGCVHQQSIWPTPALSLLVNILYRLSSLVHSALWYVVKTFHPSGKLQSRHLQPMHCRDLSLQCFVE